MQPHGKRKRSGEEETSTVESPLKQPRTQEDQWTVGLWEKLGKGAYATVHRLAVFHNRLPYRTLAIKWIKVTRPPGLTQHMEIEEEDIAEEELVDEDDTTAYKEALDEVVGAGLLSELVLTRRSHTRPGPRINGKTHAFLRAYACLLVEVTPQNSSTLLPMPLPTPGYYMGLVTELGDLGTLYTEYLKRGRRLPTAHAAICMFELCWAFMVAHTQMGLLYHGDFGQSRNLVFKQRKATELGRSLQYRLLSPVPGGPLLGQWTFHVDRDGDLPQACVIDWGFASFLTPGELLRTATSDSRRHQAYHCPPELYFGQSAHRNDRSDVWQLGILLFSLLAPLPMGVLEAWAVNDAQWHLLPPGEEKQRVQYVHQNLMSAVDCPLVWVTALTQSKGLEPPAFGASVQNTKGSPEDEENLLLQPQARLGQRFVYLLSHHPDLPATADFLHELSGDDTWNAHKYARYLSIAVLQEVLGNGWRPSPEVAAKAGYSMSPLYWCLTHPVMEAFFKEYVLDRRWRLWQTMEYMVHQLEPGARDLLKRLLTWDYLERPSCQTVLFDPWFTQYLSAAPQANPMIFQTEALSVMTAEGMPSQRKHAEYLAQVQSELRERIAQTGILETRGQVETALVDAVRQ